MGAANAASGAVAAWPRSLVAQGDGAVQEVFQLAHIAREGQAAHSCSQGRAGQRRHGQAVSLRDAGQQALAQQGQVFAALAQRRGLHVNDVQAVEQVLAKAPVLHIVGQVAVRGAQDAHVDALLLGGTPGRARCAPGWRAAAWPAWPGAGSPIRPRTRCRRWPPGNSPRGRGWPR